ncbi:MAG: glycoside hydrolase family 127 protein [Clostridia bacterium]|nr:glycoside hydrolase family 127 protein [Clostridia bacterium]
MMQSKCVPFENVDITGGFYAEKQKLVRDVTLGCVYDRFADTGRIGAFEMDYREGEPNRPHYFWDSDVAKWMESAAYLLRKKRDPELEAKVDHLVDCIEAHRMDDGYFNIYFQLFCPEKRFTDRDCHELYCAGHLLEAAIAYEKATGKGKFLSLMKDYMALIDRVFRIENSAGFSSPGHEEIELALVKLYDHTGEKKWLDLSEHFVNMRGRGQKPGKDSSHSKYIQDHLPVREQLTAEGHAVRACYFYSAAADLAKRTGDEGLLKAADSLFDNITERRMYLTGSIGSTAAGEAFEGDYVLPLDTAYAETCATLSLALFARRMSELHDDAKYADTVERVIYNGFLSGLSLDGRSFFYENAQKIDLKNRKEGVHYPITERVEVFGCSCCPPNVTRFIASIGDFMYNYNEDTVYVNQYMQSRAVIGGAAIEQITDYPYNGNVKIRVTGKINDLALRVPGWCGSYSIFKDGKAAAYDPVRGFAHLGAVENCEIALALEIKPEYRTADPHNEYCRNKAAITYGPFVLCAESVDNGGDLDGIKLTKEPPKVTKGFAVLNLSVPVLKNGEPYELKMIPYYAFANRGTTDMSVWFDI